MYAMEATVTVLIPWIRALEERVLVTAPVGALTELGDVNTCLKALVG